MKVYLLNCLPSLIVLSFACSELGLESDVKFTSDTVLELEYEYGERWAELEDKCIRRLNDLYNSDVSPVEYDRRKAEIDYSCAYEEQRLQDAFRQRRWEIEKEEEERRLASKDPRIQFEIACEKAVDDVYNDNRYNPGPNATFVNHVYDVVQKLEVEYFGQLLERDDEKLLVTPHDLCKMEFVKHVPDATP